MQTLLITNMVPQNLRNIPIYHNEQQSWEQQSLVDLTFLALHYQSLVKHI